MTLPDLARICCADVTPPPSSRRLLWDTVRVLVVLILLGWSGVCIVVGLAAMIVEGLTR